MLYFWMLQAVLEMSREEFYALPSWKQQKLKQQVELFWAICSEQVFWKSTSVYTS